ncbi:MAG: hypothetical protein HQ456_02495 [Polynucleobacter sp.]|nr:hypothetical protein [Polynucleobacter sp.]
MINALLIISYFIALVTIKNKKNLFIFFFSIFFFITGTKTLELYQSDSYIDNELIAPLQISSSGKKILIDLIPKSTHGHKQPPDYGFMKNQEVNNTNLVSKSRTEIENRKFVESIDEPTKVANWMVNNSVLVDSNAVFRGKFFHHYSTILQPLRELEAGNYSYGLISQYGLITLLPLLFINNLPFIYYGLLSLCLLLIFGGLLIISNRDSPQKMLIITVLVSVIALTIDIPAVRLSPGFTYLRYFPLMVLAYLANRQLSSPTFVMVVILGAILALLNSIQFNLIFLIATFIGYSLIRFIYKDQSDIKIYYLPIVVLVVTCLQILLYVQESNSFTPGLFSSVGDGQRSTSYAVAILFLPILIKLISAIDLKKLFAIKSWEAPSLIFTKSEILAFTIYPLCATYAISFAGSPQHFSGFLVMASYSLYIIFVTNLKELPRTVLVLLMLVAIPYYFGFIKISQPFIDNSSEIFEYQNVGKPLIFKTAMNIDQLSRDFDDITQNYGKQDSIYFLSRDKVFIETQRNTNLYPKIYDVYLNLINYSPDAIIDDLKKDHIKYLVLDSKEQRFLTRKLIDIFGSSVNPAEINAHIKILKNIDLLAYKLKDNILKCNLRYCIYRID